MILTPNKLWGKIFFPFSSKALWSRINSCYSILVSKLKPKRILSLVELLVVTWFVLARKQRPELEISDETWSGGGKAGLREAREVVSKGTKRGAVGKGTQRGSVGEGKCREAVDNGGEWRAFGFEWTVQRMSESTEVRKATAKTRWATQWPG